LLTVPAGRGDADAEPRPRQHPARKLDALRKSSTALPGTFYRLNINVSFQDHVNVAGVNQKACTLSGDCVSGCNFSAKNTVLMNYLPDAFNHGAEIYTQGPGPQGRGAFRRGWLVFYRALAAGREEFDSPDEFVEADLVVLAAGTLGSTEDSAPLAEGRPGALSQVGRHFTGNGDVLAFSYNTDEQIDGIGWGHRRHLPPVGPCITGVIDLRQQQDLDDGMVIEEGSIPGALAGVLPGIMAAGRGLRRHRYRAWLAHRLKEGIRRWSRWLPRTTGRCRTLRPTSSWPTTVGPARCASTTTTNSRWFWPGVADEAIFGKIEDNLKAATRPLNGVFVKNPISSRHLGESLISVHPLADA